MRFAKGRLGTVWHFACTGVGPGAGILPAPLLDQVLACVCIGGVKFHIIEAMPYLLWCTIVFSLGRVPACLVDAGSECAE